MGEPQESRQPAPQPPPPPLVESQQALPITLQHQQQQQQQLFAGVKFFLAQCNQPDRLKSILIESGAKHINYLSESVTHCIADSNCPEAEEAVELFDKPVVNSTWIYLSLKANTLLPVEAFSPTRSLFKPVVAAFSRHLSLEDVHSLAATLTFYGASVVKDPHKATHLIVPSANASDLKPDKQLPYQQTLKLVSPDWVLESVELNSMCDEHLFNPILLLPPKPPPQPVQPPPPPPLPSAQLVAGSKKSDTKTGSQQSTETVDIKDKTPLKSEPLDQDLKTSHNHIKPTTQCQKISHSHNQSPVPQIHSQLPRPRTPSVLPRGMPQHKFRPLLPPVTNVPHNPQSVLQHQPQQRPPTLDVQQPKKVTINYGNQYMKPSLHPNHIDSQPHTPHPHQFHQTPQHNQMQPQAQQTMQQQQYPVQIPNQIQHVVQHQHPHSNQHQVQHPHQHHHQVQLQYQPQHQQYVQPRPQHVRPTQMQPEHQQQHIHIQPQNQPYQVQHQQFVPQQESQVTQTQTFSGQQASYPVHEQPALCQTVPQEMAPIPRQTMRPVQPSYPTHQQIVRSNQVRAPVMQYKTQQDKIHFQQQSNYSQFDGGEIVNNANISQGSTLPSSNVHWQVIPGSQNRMAQPQHQQFLNSTQAPVQQQQQLTRPPVVQRPPIRAQLRPSSSSQIDQQSNPRPSPQRFHQSHQKRLHYPQDQDTKSNQDSFEERASNTVNQATQPQPTSHLHQQKPACSSANVYGYESSLIAHPSIFNQTQESSMEKIKARVPQVDADVEYFGHDPRVNVPQDAPFTGCRFRFIDYSSIDPVLKGKWFDSIKTAGGQFEESLDHATHLICENRLTDEYSDALKRGIRCVTIYWVSDVLGKDKMTHPWKALHLPLPFDKSVRPLRDQIIAVTNFKGRDRREIKEMVKKTGAKFTDYFSSSNTLIICGNVGGDKYERAIEWGVPIANCRLLSDILLRGEFELAQMLTRAKYQLFNVSEPLKIYSYHDIRNLMLPWTKPMLISEKTSVNLKNSVNGITSMSTNNSCDDSGIATGSNNSDQEAAVTADKHISNVVLNENDQSNSIPKSEITSLKINNDNVPINTVATVSSNGLQKIKRRSTKPIKILFTHLNSDLLEKLKKCAEKFGLIMADHYLGCTHLVVDRISRTPKFICAFSHAEYILSYKWLIDSHDANDLLDEKYFLLQDREGEELYSLNLVYSLMKRKKRNGLLFNNLVFFVTPTVVANVSNVNEMIESAGGIVTNRKPPSKMQVDQLKSESKKIVVITCEDDFHICSMFEFTDVELVDKEFVISGILRQDIDYESHRIKFKNPSHEPVSQLTAPSPPKKLRFDNSSC